jgi:hypothetical protein
MILWTFAQVSTGGWVAIVVAAISVIGTVATAVAHVRKADAEQAAARAPVELAAVKADASRDKDASKRFLTEHGLAERLLEEEREAHDRTRVERDNAESNASHYLVQNADLLVRVDQAEKEADEHRTCRELVEGQRKEILELSVKVGECEARHEAQERFSDRMFKHFESRLRALEPPHSTPPPTPERERSITPVHGTPAVPKE